MPASTFDRPGAARPVTLPLILLMALLPLVATPAAGRAQDAPPRPPACQDETFRAFDYWVGEWVVRNGEGREVGRNRISVVSGGCGLLEEWTSAAGGTGRSLNFFEPASGDWRQVWVGAGGSLLDLRGGLDDGVMTLEGESVSPEGPVLNRISWIPRDRGVVEQLWEISSDGGTTWRVAFQGFYEPAAG
jgi:hypothetical protein